MAEYDSVIPAGGSGTLTAKLKTSPSQNTRVSKTINVFTDSPGAESLKLRFVVDVRMPIKARPSPRFMLNTIEGTETGQRLALNRTDGVPLEIRSMSSPMKGLRVTATGVDSGARPARQATATPWGSAAVRDLGEVEDGAVWLDLRIDPTVPAGRHSGAIRITTNHPEFPEMEIPYTVRVRPVFEVRPARVKLWLNANGGGRTSTVVTLIRHGTKPFTIKTIATSLPDVLTAVPNNRTPSTQQSVRVGLVEGEPRMNLGSNTAGWVRIEIDNDAGTKLEVPVTITRNRPVSQR